MILLSVKLGIKKKEIEYKLGVSMKKVFVLLIISIIFPLTFFCQANAPGIVRNLSDYTNNDGKVPDGLDNAIDDTDAMKSALSAGPGVVRIGPGHFRFSDVEIPSDVMVVGSGLSTVVHPIGTKVIFHQKKKNRWILRDMVLDGGADKNWKERKEQGQSGILIEHSTEWEISGLVIRNMNGAGVEITYAYSAAPWKNNGTIINVQSIRNYVGIRFGKRAEYINSSALGCYENVIGCVINGGNIKITNSNFNSNLTGILIEDKENGSHGSITNCLVNHNQKYSLLCREVNNGMLINSCCFFGGTMLIEDSEGVNVTSGIIACDVKVIGEKTNRIAGNNIRGDFTYEFAPSTIVQDNFPSFGLKK